MTEQYAQRNINPSSGSSVHVATGPNPDFTIRNLSGLAIINTTLSPSNVTMPRARDAGPNARISVIKVAAANVVTLVAASGDTLVSGAAGISIGVGVLNGSLTLAADPATNSWYVVGSTV